MFKTRSWQSIFAGHGRNFWELDSDLQNINRRAQNGFSCFRFLLGWQIFALLYNAAGQLHIKGEEAKYWVWIYWDSNQQRTSKRVQGPNNGKREDPKILTRSKTLLEALPLVWWQSLVFWYHCKAPRGRKGEFTLIGFLSSANCQIFA